MNLRRAKAFAVICGFITAATFGLTISIKAFENPRHASTVRIHSGEQHGSGVIIKESQSGYLVVTNEHVLSDDDVHCIESSNGGRYEGVLVPLANNKEDLALLWFKSQALKEQVATLSSDEEEIGEPIKLVTATGYPATKNYVERAGLTIPLLSEPLEGGYTLTYTSQIDKGMSGGGVFDEDDRLIGINATHQEPLWDANWKYQSGKPVTIKMTQKINRLALGLRKERIIFWVESLNMANLDLTKSARENNKCLEDQQSSPSIKKPSIN